MSNMDKCWKVLPLDGSRPTNLIEVNWWKFPATVLNTNFLRYHVYKELVLSRPQEIKHTIVNCGMFRKLGALLVPTFASCFVKCIRKHAPGFCLKKQQTTVGSIRALLMICKMIARKYLQNQHHYIPYARMHSL